MFPLVPVCVPHKGSTHGSRQTSSFGLSHDKWRDRYRNHNAAAEPGMPISLLWQKSDYVLVKNASPLRDRSPRPGSNRNTVRKHGRRLKDLSIRRHSRHATPLGEDVKRFSSARHSFFEREKHGTSRSRSFEGNRSSAGEADGEACKT